MKINEAMSRFIAYTREYGFPHATKRSLRHIGKSFYNLLVSIPYIDSIAYRKSLNKLNAKKSNERRLDSIIREAKTFRGVGLYKSISPQQNDEEIKKLANKVKKNRPNTIVEIGTAKGGTLYIWSRFIDSAHEIVSVDIGSTFEKRKKFFDKFDKKKDIKFVNGYSQEESTKRKVYRKTEKSVDFLFIDGADDYESVKKDYEIYSKIVNEGGIIAFHDIIDKGFEKMEVPKLWREIRKDHDYEEVNNAEDAPGRGGIGILYL